MVYISDQLEIIIQKRGKTTEYYFNVGLTAFEINELTRFDVASVKGVVKAENGNLSLEQNQKLTQQFKRRVEQISKKL